MKSVFMCHNHASVIIFWAISGPDINSTISYNNVIILFIDIWAAPQNMECYDTWVSDFIWPVLVASRVHNT